ncbi:MAG: hypothetical protein ABI685_09425 [Ferruginibacter sp.]
MRIKHLLIASAMVAFTFGITSCKKDNNNSTTTDTATETKTQADDQSFFSNETDIATNEANASFETYAGSATQTPVGIETPPGFTLPCDAAVTVDTASSPRTITIVYNGNSCDLRRTRTGTIIISFAQGFRWREANASLTAQFVDFKVTRKNDSKSVVINGTRIITNVSGGLLRDLATTDSIVHKIDDTNMTVTFDNDKKRTWETHFTRIFKYNNGIVVSTTGHVIGTNRFGDAFTSTITQPLVITQSCDFNLVSGQVQHTGAKITSTLTFGLDAAGNPVSNCPVLLYYKVVWTGPNGSSLIYIGVY